MVKYIMPVNELLDKLREFARERDWDQFHTPKNLAMALSVEVSEIVELFQWLESGHGDELPPQKLQALREEIGDVLIYLVTLAGKFGIDPFEAAFEKLEINRRKYPPGKSRGRADKYSDL